jgi:hypothetical protein
MNEKSTNKKPLYVLLTLLLGGFVFLFYKFYLNPGSKIAPYVGHNKVGGMLLAMQIEPGSRNEDGPFLDLKRVKKGSQAESNQLKSSLNFLIIHFHLNNPKVLGITLIPGNLKIGTGDNVTDLERLYMQDPRMALAELNKLIPLKVNFHYIFKKDQIANILNFLGGIYVFHGQGLGLEPGILHLGGDRFIKYWDKSISQRKSETGQDHFLVSRDLLSNMVLSILGKFRMKRPVFSEKMQRGIIKKLFPEDNGNLSFDEFNSLFTFFSGKLESITNLYLPLVRVMSHAEAMYEIRKDALLEKSLEKYLYELSTEPEERFIKNRKNGAANSSQARITVEVLNASGIYRQAKKIRNQLSGKNIPVIQFQNFIHGNIARSVVLIRNFSALGKEKQILELNRILGFEFPIVYSLDTSLLSDLTVILGKDFQSE